MAWVKNKDTGQLKQRWRGFGTDSKWTCTCRLLFVFILRTLHGRNRFDPCLPHRINTTLNYCWLSLTDTKQKRFWKIQQGSSDMIRQINEDILIMKRLWCKWSCSGRLNDASDSTSTLDVDEPLCFMTLGHSLHFSEFHFLCKEREMQHLSCRVNIRIKWKNVSTS